MLISNSMEDNDSYFGSHDCRKDTPYKIYISSSKSEQPEFLDLNASSPQCVRCGSEMKGFQSVFVTICPPLVQPKSDKSNASSNSAYSKYSLSKPFHIGKENMVVNSDDDDINRNSLSSIIPDSKVCCSSCKNIIAFDLNNDKPSLSCALNTNNHAANYGSQDPNDSYESSSESNSLPSVSSCSCKFHTPRSSNYESNDGTSTDLTNDSISPESLYSQCGDSSNDSVSDVDSPKHLTMENTTWNDRPRAFEILTDTSVTPCKDCHVAVEDTRTDSNDGLEIVSLMFQISNNSQAYHWEYECPPSSKVDVAVRVDSLGFFPEMIADSGK